MLSLKQKWFYDQWGDQKHNHLNHELIRTYVKSYEVIIVVVSNHNNDQSTIQLVVHK